MADKVRARIRDGLNKDSISARGSESKFDGTLRALKTRPKRYRIRSPHGKYIIYSRLKGEGMGEQRLPIKTRAGEKINPSRV